MEQICGSNLSILFCWSVHGQPMRSCRGVSPATLRSLTASNRSERENVYGNQEIQQYEPNEKIFSEEKLQQEEVEHQKIQSQGRQECRAGDEGIQGGKAEEWIGPEGHESQTGHRDWAVGSEKVGRQGAEEKNLQLKSNTIPRGNLQPVLCLSATPMFSLGIQMEVAFTSEICDKA